MATIEIWITQQGDFLVPDKTWAPLATDDTVTFYADQDVETALCIGAPASAVLSPDPGARVTIPAGGSTTFQISSAEPGNYCILTQSADWPCPTTIDCGNSAPAAGLRIAANTVPPFAGPEDDTKT